MVHLRVFWSATDRSGRRRHAVCCVSAGAGLALATAIVPSAARADPFHRQTLPLGQRAVGMGSAFTAVADDPSATYYNPAGLGILDDGALSASLTVTAFDRLQISHGYRTSRANASLSHDQGTSLPVFASAVKRVGAHTPYGQRRHAIAFSTFTVSARQLNFDVEAMAPDHSSVDTLTVDLQERTAWSGLSYGVFVTPHLSLGISTFLSIEQTRYDEERISSTLGAVNADGSYASSSSTWVHHLVHTNVKNLVARIGALYTVDERLSLGIMFQPPSVHLRGRADVRERAANTDLNATPATSTLFDASEGGLSSQSPIPWELRLGFSYELYDWLRIAGDSSLYGANGTRTHPIVAIGPRKPDPQTGAVPEPGNFIAETWYRTMSGNLALGAEALFKEHYTARAGVYTDFSSAPSIPRTATAYYAPDIHRIGITASVGLLEQRSDISLGMIGVFGTGHAQSYSPDSGINTSTYQRTRATERMFLVFINGVRSAVNVLAKRANERLQKAREEAKTSAQEAEPPARPEPQRPAH